MDKDYIKNVLTDELDTSKLIRTKDTLDSSYLLELSLMGKKTKTPDFQKIFAPISSGMKAEYFINCKCSKCNSPFKATLSKSEILRILKELRKSKDLTVNSISICDSCKRKGKELEKEKHKQLRMVQQANLDNKIKSYLDYIDPNRYFVKGITIKEKVDSIMGYFTMQEQVIADPIIQETVLSLSYEDFLNTPYWEGIRIYKLYKAKYRCQLCNKNNTSLHVHHKTYDNHGLEHRFDVANNDLIVLCEDCHRKFHDIDE